MSLNFRGKDYDVKLNKPLSPKKDRERPATPTKPLGRDGKCSRRIQKQAQGMRLTVPTTSFTRDVKVVKKKKCDFATEG